MVWRIPLLLSAGLLSASDTNCPRYPEQALVQSQIDFEYQRSAESLSKSPPLRQAAARTVASNNFIDDFIFNKMAAAEIPSAPLTSDQEFLRRVYLDLTGRIPPPERVEAFLGDTSSGKRGGTISALMDSEAFIDNWTQYLANKFEVTSSYYNEIPLEARNSFHWWLRAAVKTDKPYNQLATELITATGFSSKNAPLNFLVRGWQEGDPIQDTWDTLTDRVTTRFLGIKTECVSCHDGRRHLEQINLYMSTRRRQEFWRMSAFFSRMSLQRIGTVWAQFFRRGIVDPADAWDPARVDPNNPPPSTWPMQSSHPELLEALTDKFIESGYRMRPLIRLIVESNAYQLSSRYEGQWKAEYAWYFAKQTPRRLTAEEVYDALISATQTEVPMYIHGFPEPIYYAMQLPDPTEPRSEFNIRNFLTQFGRGDWWTIPRKSDPSLLQVLYLMNDYMNVSRTLPTGPQGSNTRVARLAQAPIREDEVVKQLFLATLSRLPTREEQDTIDRLRKGSREQWLSDVQWSLLNKLDFIFNY